MKYAQELWERIRRECELPSAHRIYETRTAHNFPVPELRIYRFWDKPIGPHPVAMFEVNLFTPAQFGAFIPWLAIYRGPLSVLVHPNTVGEQEDRWGEALRNHTQRAIWMGERLPLDLYRFNKAIAAQTQKA